MTPVDISELTRLEDKAFQLRTLTLKTVQWAGGGHIGGSLSAMDILTVLYHHVMNFSVEKATDPDRDRFILSKGHIGVGFAPVLSDLGFFPEEWLHNYNKTGSPLGMHPDSKKVPGVEASTGSLGHGLSVAAGMANASKISGRDFFTYCLLGDGECNEGSVWEAAMAASQFGLDHLVAIVDRNHAMIDGPTEDVMGLEPFADKWTAFGWKVIDVNGNSIPDLVAVFAEAKRNGNEKTGMPTVLIADTVKGEGIDSIAGDYTWHYGSFSPEKAVDAEKALAEHHDRRLAALTARPAKGEEN